MSDVTDATESLPSGLQILSDPVFLFSRDGTPIDWNRSAREVSGYGEDELSDIDVGRLFVDGDGIHTAVSQAVATGEYTFEVTLRTAGGDEIPYEFVFTPLPEDRPESTVAVGRELRRETVNQELQSREQALRRAYEVIAAPERSLDSKIDGLLHAVRETLGTTFATLSRVQDGEYHLEGLVGPGGESSVDVPGGETVEEGDTLPLEVTNCERVVATKRTLAFGDVERDMPELADRPVNADIGITSYVGAPVVVEGDPYGTFCFYDKDASTDGFSEWEVTFVELLSDWVSNQLERERLMEKRRDKQLRSLLEHSSDRLSVLDEERTYTFVSPAVEHLLGYDPAQLMGTSELDKIHPEDCEGVETTFDRILENPGETYNLEYRIRDAEGTWRWVETRATNKLDDPAIEGIVVNSRDITERKEREQKLEEEQAFTESIFEALPDVLYAFDEHGTFLRWNDRFSAVTGYDDEEIEEMQPTEFIAPEDIETVAEAISKVFEADVTVTVEADFLTKDGERVPYEFTGAKMTDREGETLGLVGIGRDISDRKERQRRFEAVFNNTYQFTGLMETDGTLLEANRTALEFGGLDRTDVVGSKLWDANWFQASESARETAREAVETARNGELYRDEISVQGENGTEIIDFSVRPVLDEESEVSSLIPEGRKISDLKRRERHLGVLHRFLRHNLRNKMTVINGSAEQLLETVEDPDTEKFVVHIEGAASELLELSETANELSKAVIEADTELQPVPLAETVEEVVDTFDTQYPSATIDVSSDTDYLVMADWRLDKVFEELIENALEHTDEDHPTVELSTAVTGGAVAVSVTDYGPGIPENELAGIVNDEEQTQLTHGSGFGLWLVRSVVDEYGGTLTYEPVPDGGSVLTVSLPLAAAE